MATVTEPLTAEQFMKLPYNGQIQELVRGRIVEMPPPKFLHGVVCGNIYFLIRSHVQSHRLGRVLANDSGLITERNPDTVRGPDIAYYSFQRVPHGQEPAGYSDVAPELVFEVLSPDDRWPRLQTKIAEYLAAGVKMVCVADPASEAVTVYREDSAPHTLTADDTLHLDYVLAGLSIPVGRFFE
jgi:Uma2 family endonuclease